MLASAVVPRAETRARSATEAAIGHDGCRNIFRILNLFGAIGAVDTKGVAVQLLAKV